MKRAGRIEWGRAARSTKKKSSPLEPGKVIIKEFPSYSQPTYGIHSRKDYNTQKTPYLRSEMSDTSGERRWRTQANLELGHWTIPKRKRKEANRLEGLGSEPKSSALRSGPIFRTARTALAKPTSSPQHPREGSGTKAHDRNQEVGVCPCALQAQKGTGPSVSLHVDRRAKISLSARSCGKR